MRYAAGIVLYNPEINRLKENISAVIVQCEHVYLVDNGSGNIADVKTLLERFNPDKLTLLQNEKNEGIAKALNQLGAAAQADGYDWLLTLDQDSVCPSNMIEEYDKCATDEKAGMLCPLIMDRNKGEFVRKISEGAVGEVDECITSGSLLRLSVWKELNGFDESMFIDGVDFDICHRIRKAGYKILCIGNVILSHEIGHIEFRRFLFWRVLVKNHSAFRKYYIARNTVYLARKEGTSLVKALLQNVKLLLINWGYEEDKGAKTRKIVQGTKDGLKYPLEQ